MLSILAVVCLTSYAFANPITPQAANAGAQVIAPPPGKPDTEGITTFDGVPLENIEARPAPAALAAAAISKAGWTCTADSSQAENPCTNVLDGDPNTIWHTQFNPTVANLPHVITIDMKTTYKIGSVGYQPRPDGLNGNIGQHELSFSTDGTNFVTVVYGTFIDDNSLKTSTFTARNARYVRLRALTEAGGRGQWTAAAEINVFTTDEALPPNPAGKGLWTTTINWPLVPVSLANIYSTGNLLAWSSYNPSTFGGGNGQQTITATYAPGTQKVTQALITNTQHDMFCEGLSLDFNGRYISTGGNAASATSIFDPALNGGSWSKGAAMNIARGYQSQVTVSTGTTFVIGASWSGGLDGKNGELYNEGSGTWARLTGAPVAPIYTADAEGVYRSDNHAWLFAWKGASVFQAGPSRAMNWYGTTGAGSQTGAGTRLADGDSMCGVAAMYDAVAGKILTVGGSPDYQDSDASSNAHIITLGAPNTNPTVQKITNAAYARAFHNSVILPDGKVLIIGGQSRAVPFSDNTAQFIPELFDPATNTFTQLAPMAIPRTYHSTAVLLPDATVISAGGGLCGNCATNHYDGQIFRPPYLYTGTGADAGRPVINAVSVASIGVGGTFTATTNGAVTGGFSIVRLSSTTHTVNTDQRRIKLTPTATNGNTYTLVIPNDAGVSIPGYWMLFAINGAGVPSVARTLKVTPT